MWRRKRGTHGSRGLSKLINRTMSYLEWVGGLHGDFPGGTLRRGVVGWVTHRAFRRMLSLIDWLIDIIILPLFYFILFILSLSSFVSFRYSMQLILFFFPFLLFASFKYMLLLFRLPSFSFFFSSFHYYFLIPPYPPFLFFRAFVPAVPYVSYATDTVKLHLFSIFCLVLGCMGVDVGGEG